MEVLGVVQARGGSKGIPGKNIRNLGGYPLIAYSIASALASESITRLIISTDDDEIAEVARIYGAEVPFMRPDELATDDAQDFPLFEHALAWLKSNENYVPQIIVQLRPTSPLRPKGLIDTAVKLLSEDNYADCVRTVILSQQNPYKMWRADEKYLNPLLGDEFPEPYNMPRQKLPKTYWQTGHLDIIRYETITKKKSLTGERVLPLIIEPKYCTDIDTLEDWENAEWKLSRNNLDIDFPKEGVRNK
ncbi:acylneuraminate cytidylyltransferase family protein [Candidatus Poribacteria bacterium]|nr:MAG: acylneuraminate cytidylyltransferase family protein [Candidatus Poribacteria bacterium]